ncbi:MAG: heme ABC transporter ATP-binding protein [Verrucomicrobiota bacterium]
MRANNIEVIRGGKAILARQSLSLQPGELNVVLGPNGAGKSTLLKVLTGELEPDSGQVFYEEVPLAELDPPEIARRRAVLGQSSSLAFDFSVAEVVMLGRIPHLSSWESPKDRQACAEALEAVEMADFRHRSYPSLSGGEQQRVHLARVLAQLDAHAARAEAAGERRAAWLFLDEPTSALDLRHQHAVLELARRLARERGIGILAILHDLNLALRYADRVVLLSQGQQVAAGEPLKTLTAENVGKVYGVRAEIVCSAYNNCPLINVLHQEPATSNFQ